MPTYFVDDGGDNTDGSTWAKAYTSIQSLDTAVAIASGDIIYIGADSNCTDKAAALTITGPSSGYPVKVISSTVGSGTTVSYSKGTGDQILATGATSDITFDGAFHLEGIRVKAGRHILMQNDTDEIAGDYDCTFSPGVGAYVDMANVGNQGRNSVKAYIELQEVSNNATSALYLNGAGRLQIQGMTFNSAAQYKTLQVFAGAYTNGSMFISDCDFSGFPAATCEIFFEDTGRYVTVTNCKMASSWIPYRTGPVTGSIVMFTNCGPSDAPTSLIYYAQPGSITSTTSIYRSGGATVSGVATSWLFVSDNGSTKTTEQVPFQSPWIYGALASTGSKTFTLYITNDTADFTDAEVWLEVEYLATSGSGQWTLASDHRATILTTAAAQADDTGSTWNGAGPSYTYKQSLAVTATVGQAGMYRARVCVGVEDIASTRYFYIDPLVTVS